MGLVLRLDFQVIRDTASISFQRLKNERDRQTERGRGGWRRSRRDRTRQTDGDSLKDRQTEGRQSER